MRLKLVLILLLTLGLLAVLVSLVQTPKRPNAAGPQQTAVAAASNATDASLSGAIPQPSPVAAPSRRNPRSAASIEPFLATTNKLERLAQIREAFRQLASGDPSTALQAAKQIKDLNERETALLTLVTEWTQGELRSPLERAQAIAMYGVEAGLGLELARNPDLALTWANTLTQGTGRQVLLAQAAVGLAASDPTAAFALGDQLPEDQRRGFLDAVFAGWAGKDTEAALQWANQLSDPAERDAAVAAIRTTAPVGIGTALGVQDGYPVVQQLLPGTPAELSGQLHQGDRIVALAQGDDQFVDVHGVPLQQLVQMIRGAPGTPVQLQILPAGAAPDAPPQTVSIVRDQLKWKN